MEIAYITTPLAAALLFIAVLIGWQAKRTEEIGRRIKLHRLSEFIATGAFVIGIVGGVATLAA